MVKIITISREFGSGGRELGKRLADVMGYEYYDREIIAAIAENKGMDEGYVEKMLESQSWKSRGLHFRNSFSRTMAIGQTGTDLLLEQKKVVEEIAKAGKNCVIVGRNADILLGGYMPFKLFVCADMEAKIRRCVERAEDGKVLSRKELERKIRQIDKGRMGTREIVTGIPWRERSAYHLVINTSGWDMKELTQLAAKFAETWFERRENDTVIGSL